MTTCLVTGGAGFIGSHLVERLLAAKHRVVVLDDLSTGRRENLAAVSGHPHLEVHIGSVCDGSRVASLVERVDRIFHLAASVGVRLIVEQPVRTIETNVRGTEVVLGQACRTRTPVLLTSSSEVYGKGVQPTFAEDDDLVLGNTRTARWAYACSKALDEYLAMAFARERELPVVIVRPFNTAGPRQTGRYGMVIPTFVRQARAGEPITVHGDGRQSRCFCHVDDVVRALIELSESPAATGGVFNVGSTEEVTILDLAGRVRRIAGSDSEIRLLAYEDAWEHSFEDMRRRVPDLTRIRSVIGFAPTYGLDDIIRDVIGTQRHPPEPT